MTRRGKFTLRFALFGAVLLYLAGDLFLFKGPMRRMIDHANPRGPEASRVVARVFNLQITRSQLDRAVRERLWFEGETFESLTRQNRKIARYAALDELLDHELLRIKAKINAPQIKVSDEEINGRLRRFSDRFESKGAMASAMKSQGIASEKELRDRLAARIQQEKYVESEIGPLATVTDGEARKWFDENQKDLAIPERINVRHLFLPTLDHPPEEAKARLDVAMADLTAKRKDFATLAREISEDTASKDNGGDLGWMTRSRLPDDFADAVFLLPQNQPKLVRTRLGWHLVEVIARKPAEPQTFEQTKPEIIAALEAIKRLQATTEFRDALRRSAAGKINVDHDMMAE